MATIAEILLEQTARFDSVVTIGHDAILHADKGIWAWSVKTAMRMAGTDSFVRCNAHSGDASTLFNRFVTLREGGFYSQGW